MNGNTSSITTCMFQARFWEYISMMCTLPNMIGYVFTDDTWSKGTWNTDTLNTIRLWFLDISIFKIIERHLISVDFIMSNLMRNVLRKLCEVDFVKWKSISQFTPLSNILFITHNVAILRTTVLDRWNKLPVLTRLQIYYVIPAKVMQHPQFLQ